MSKQRFRQRRRSRGVAAVEFALVLGPMLVLTFGVAEFGRAIYTYNAIDKAARDAARYLTAPPDTSTDPIVEARNLVRFGNVAGTGALLAPGLTAAMVVICDTTSCPSTHASQPMNGGSGTIDLVTVSINGYVYDSIITYVAPPTLDFNDISVTMRADL